MALIGPRQAGKTSAGARGVQDAAGASISISSPIRLAAGLTRTGRASREPELYLSQHQDKLVILDEIERAPQIFQSLRGLIDSGRRRGRRQGPLSGAGLRVDRSAEAIERVARGTQSATWSSRRSTPVRSAASVSTHSGCAADSRKPAGRFRWRHQRRPALLWRPRDRQPADLPGPSTPPRAGGARRGRGAAARSTAAGSGRSRRDDRRRRLLGLAAAVGRRGSRAVLFEVAQLDAWSYRDRPWSWCWWVCWRALGPALATSRIALTQALREE